MLLFVRILCIFSLICISCSKPHDPKLRTVDKTSSDAHHYENGVHNAQYDHEAFLGADEAKKDSSLTPDDSRKLLGELVDRIDTNNDGFVDFDELQSHLRNNSRRYIEEDVDRAFNEYKAEFHLDYITLANYKIKIADDLEDDEDEDGADPDLEKVLRREERRFKAADVDGDEKLSREEFANFLHPEECEHMRDIVIDETIEDIDTNGDKHIQLDEYIDDMWDRKQNPQMPKWVEDENLQFKEVRDKDKNGYLDRDEVKQWMFPEDYNHIISEARHLIEEADDDDDKKLSKDEILRHYDVFMSSQATDFGQALRPHEEL